MKRLLKPSLALALLALGIAVGIASVALHALWWGLLLGMLTTVATLYALPPGWWSRLAFGLGWVGLVAWVTTPRSEGDYLISSEFNGYALLMLGAVVLVAAVLTLPRGRHADEAPARVDSRIRPGPS